MEHPNVPILECSQKNKSISFDGRNREATLQSFQRGGWVNQICPSDKHSKQHVGREILRGTDSPSDWSHKVPPTANSKQESQHIHCVILSQVKGLKPGTCDENLSSRPKA